MVGKWAYDPLCTKNLLLVVYRILPKYTSVQISFHPLFTKYPVIFAQKKTPAKLFAEQSLAGVFIPFDRSGCCVGLALRSQLHIHPGRDAGRPCALLAQPAKLLTDMVRTLAVLKRNRAVFHL